MKTIHLKFIFMAFIGVLALLVCAGIFEPPVSSSLDQKDIKNPLVK